MDANAFHGTPAVSAQRPIITRAMDAREHCYGIDHAQLVDVLHRYGRLKSADN
ncbi:MAG: hypothetical protein GY875_07975 [Gammaproteobacteria bacterium]|nr:hypothetical protein [Gammaproteobacteria bacterium]